MIVYFYDLKQGTDQRPLELYIKYFEYLSIVLEKFNETHNKNISKLFNQYGQEIPLVYRVQKTGLETFF